MSTLNWFENSGCRLLSYNVKFKCKFVKLDTEGAGMYYVIKEYN